WEYDLFPSRRPVHLRIKLQWILRNFSEEGERSFREVENEAGVFLLFYF
ncbi:MAG: hypothetical protein UU46_C0019G0021, partial [Candidatus Uhrbacteria bacterium GW2011_GWD1_41_16]